MSRKPGDKIRVLIVARWPVGGIRSYLRYTYGMLSPDEFTLAVVGPRSDELQDCGKILSALKPSIYPTKSASISSIAAGVLTAMRAETFDVVHSQGYSTALAAALPVALKRVPHFVTIHDMFTDALRRHWKVRLGRLGLAAALGLVDVVQPTGAAVEANFRKHMNIWPATRPRVRMIRNGVDVSRFAGDDRRDLRGELQLGHDDFLIGFLGRFMAIKGFHCLISAVEQLCREGGISARPVVVAVGSGGFMREDRAFIEQKGLTENFRFLPHTNEVGATLRALDVVAVPSFSEASPLLPMEALCSGVNVIASDAPGLVDVLRNSPAQHFPVGDSTKLAQALRHSMQARATGEVRAFRAEAMQRFSAARAAQEIRELVFELAGAASSARE